MLFRNAHKTSQGFTLIETLTVLIVIGILSAIAVPSFLALLNRNKVNDAVAKVQGALQEAQREAIRRSRSCIVTLNTTNQKVTSPCLITGDRTLPNGVAIVTNLGGTPPSITFSFRGNTTDSGAIVLYMSDGSIPKKGCLVISNGLGIMRSGVYNGSTASVTANNCVTS